MTLFDFDVLEGRTSKYETNHLHMIIDGNIKPSVNDRDNSSSENEGDVSSLVNEMDNKTYGIFIHEYVHYIQHLTTLFGVRMCDMYNRMFILYRDYLRTHDTIELPLRLWEKDKNLNVFIVHFNRIGGSRTCNSNIDEIEISDNEISEARDKRSAVKIGIYDYENGKAIENGFNFGYWCIIESMAHMIQSFIDDDLNHATIPYCAVELICKSIYSEIANDKKMMISLCMCSLMSDNPGVAFFDVVECSKKNPTLNGYDLYVHYLREYKVVYESIVVPAYKALSSFMDDWVRYTRNLIECELEYYNKVAEQCKKEFEEFDNLLLKALYREDITDRKLFIDSLVPFYGCPFIGAQDLTIMPRNNQEGRPYLETAAIIGWEFILKRMLANQNNTRCGRYEICNKEQYTKNDKISEECSFNQWDKKEQCLMTEALRYFNIKDKNYIQRDEADSHNPINPSQHHQ